VPHLRATVLAGTWRNEENERRVPTFAAFFFETYAATNHRPSTVREKRRALGRALLSELGPLRLDAIDLREVEAFKARRKQDGVGNKTIDDGYRRQGDRRGGSSAAPPRCARRKLT